MLIDRLLIKFFAKQVGEDPFGNRYFVSKCQDYLGRNKRFVVYKGIDDGSKVPALWHSWLHHLSNRIPEKISIYSWQREHIPNVTGTKYAHDPREYYLDKLKSYKSWSPKN